MRHLSSLLSSRTSARRPATDRAREDEKRATENKPVRKRCLNEAAHKLKR